MSDTPISMDPVAASTGGGQRLIQRIRFLCAMGVAAAIFWYFGRWAAKPMDPAGPITLLMVDQGVVGMAELLGLAVVVSGLAVAVCGAGCADRGPLAVAIGLATLGLRGAQMDSLLLYRMTSLRPGRSAADIFPTWGLVAETWLWLALVAVGFVVGRWVDSWFLQEGEGRSKEPEPTDFRHALGAITLAAVVAWATVSYTLGAERHGPLKGQIYFSVALGIVAGSLVAHWFFLRSSRVWMLLAVALVATAAYVLAGPDAKALAAAQQAGTYINLRSIVRPLPLEYASMGAVGALLEQDVMQFLRAMFGFQVEDESDGQA